MFKELTEEQLDLVKEILKLFPKLIDHNKSTPDADPFIVALSRAEGYCAVTSEKPANQGGRPRIPNVCKHYNIKYLDLREMFKELNWRY